MKATHQRTWWSLKCLLTHLWRWPLVCRALECMSAGNLRAARPKQCTSHCAQYKPQHTPAVSRRFCQSSLPFTGGWGVSTAVWWAVLNLSCKLHTNPAFELGWLMFGLPMFFFFILTCTGWDRTASVLSELAAFQTLHLNAPHTGEDLSPRETSVCHNPCSFRGLIGWPTDLP